jgi:hypothetical protein
MIARISLLHSRVGLVLVLLAFVVAASASTCWFWLSGASD